MDLQKKNIEKKISRLSEKNKAYILGYIDHALCVKSTPIFAKKHSDVCQTCAEDKCSDNKLSRNKKVNNLCL